MTATVAEPTEIAELTAVGKKNQHNINMDGNKHLTQLHICTQGDKVMNRNSLLKLTNGLLI